MSTKAVAAHLQVLKVALPLSYTHIFTLVSIMLTIYDEFYACIADAILSDVEEVQTIQQASQLALRDVNPRTRTLRELACGSNTKIYTKL